MKKTVFSIIFALALSVMLFVTASATESTKAEEWYNENNDSGIVLDVTQVSDGKKIKMTAYSKGENFAADFKTNAGVLRIILNSKDVIAFSPDKPYFHMKLRGITKNITFITFDVTEFSPGFVKSYEETDGETVYYVEEFANNIGEEMVYKFYFTGDELDRIEATGQYNGSAQEMTMDINSYGVDDSIFKVPWYSFNITFFVILFGLFKL